MHDSDFKRVKMINQMVLNNRALGDDNVTITHIVEHINKFWTVAMKRQLSQYTVSSDDQFHPLVAQVITCIIEQ